MNHQGTNLVGYAVGGVVDTVSDDGLPELQRIRDRGG